MNSFSCCGGEVSETDSKLERTQPGRVQYSLEWLCVGTHQRVRNYLYTCPSFDREGKTRLFNFEVRCQETRPNQMLSTGEFTLERSTVARRDKQHVLILNNNSRKVKG